MHVIAGRFKGSSIHSARHETRPTTDRTKEAIFSYLEARSYLNNTSVLDLFAGTGALGIEALSRGSATLVSVESSVPAAKLIAQNLTQLKNHADWEDHMHAKVVRATAQKYIDKIDECYDVIFLDPPYALSTDDCNALLQVIIEKKRISEQGILILERSARSQAPQIPEGWHVDSEKKYGETAVFYIIADE
ncbi:MAG: 16S rRNA (guanine(966)-N(2))-methyltransferase RsmD [Bifidobacteriaceae bacterium]|nr:16S rRNA (guanine(966)-N(2))-methyltransferase RsmD [Bifidobacteriaceae bacterium]